MVTQERQKKVIDNKQVSPNEDFVIGHSSVNSETFLPTFLYDYQNDVYYGDIAGLQDTSGPLVDFINSFLVKKIFQLASSVRFLYVMTKKQLKDARGMQIRQQIRVLQAMCSTVDIKDVHDQVTQKEQQIVDLNQNIQDLQENIKNKEEELKQKEEQQ